MVLSSPVLLGSVLLGRRQRILSVVSIVAGAAVRT